MRRFYSFFHDKLWFSVQNRIKVIYGNVYSKIQRRRLTNREFSIICSTCIGGVIYNRLKHQFLSPTINLWMPQKSFLMFAMDLKKYIEMDLTFVDDVCVNGEKSSFPIARLDDVWIYFNHAKSKEEAENDWNRRKARINYDNLYFIIYDKEDLTKEDLIKFSKIPCNNKIILSDKKYEDIDCVQTIIPNKKRRYRESYLDKDFFGKRTFEKQWDYVAWLNRKQN